MVVAVVVVVVEEEDVEQVVLFNDERDLLDYQELNWINDANHLDCMKVAHGTIEPSDASLPTENSQHANAVQKNVPTPHTKNVPSVSYTTTKSIPSPAVMPTFVRNVIYKSLPMSRVIRKVVPFVIMRR